MSVPLAYSGSGALTPTVISNDQPLVAVGCFPTEADWVGKGDKTVQEITTEGIGTVLNTYPFIVAAYQFGSTVRGQAGPLSDLDIAIVVDEQSAPPAIDLLRLELLLSHELQRRLNVREVDLIILNHQRLFLQHAVLHTGRLIYEANPTYRIRFAQKIIQAYLDFQPTLQFMARFHTAGRLRRCGIQ